MGYRYDAVVALDHQYVDGKEPNFGGYEPSEVFTKDRGVFYRFNWFKDIDGLVEEVERIVGITEDMSDEDWNDVEDTWGILAFGEEDDDTQAFGDPWGFDLYMIRDFDF